jgi:predicted amino acid dehydrogenase
MVILPALKEHCMADDTVQVELERLRAENEALKRRATKGVTLKVSKKGGVSVYGLGRFPVTLYKEQWEKLLTMSDDIRAFITEHEAELKTKEKEV